MTNSVVVADIIRSILSAHRGATFAFLGTRTPKPLAAANKHHLAEVEAYQNVVLYGTVVDAEIYKKRILKAVNAVPGQESVTDFQVSETWYSHGAPYSLVAHKKTGEQYLYYSPIGHPRSKCFLDGNEVTRQKLASLMTPSAAKEFISPPKMVENKTNGVSYERNSVMIRVIKLENIKQIRAKKTQINFT